MPIRPWMVLAVLTLTPTILAAGSTPASATLDCSTRMLPLGQEITLTATVSPPSRGSPATGKITFFDGTVILGLRPLQNGQASLATRLLPSGMRFLTAFYSGDSQYAASSSSVITLNVNSISGNGFAPAVPYVSGHDSTIVGPGIEQPWSLAIADFNGDGLPDLAVANSYGGSVGILRGNGDGTFQAPINTAVPNPKALVAGDFNGDGKTDLAVISVSVFPNFTSTLNVLLGNGDGTFQIAATYTLSTSASSVVIGDFDGNGIADLAVATSTGVTVFLGSGDGSFPARVDVALASPAKALAVADFNGDGKADLVVACQDFVAILLGSGDGTFTQTAPYSPGAAFVTLADFNGDGTTDLAIAGSNSITIRLGNGDGTFRSPFVIEGSYAGLAAADFNGDGKTDLVVYEGILGPLASVLAGNGDGTFQLPKPSPPATPSSAPVLVIGEFNGDGRPDLAIVDLRDSRNVSVLLGSAGVATQTLLTTSPNPSFYAQAVTMTATVSPPAATGSVSFFDYLGLYGPSGLLATVPLSNGRADFTTDKLTIQPYSLTAVYSGDLAYAGSTSPVVMQAVNLAPTTCMVTSSLNPSTFGQSVTITVTVTPASATGFVTFSSENGPLDMRSLGSGAANLTISTLPPGSHTLTARYSGDYNYAGSSSAPITEVVTPAAPTASTNITLTSSANSVTLGQSVTLTASVSPSDADGRAVFYDGATMLGTGPLSLGKTSISTTQLPSGIRSLRARYLGNTKYAASTSTSTTTTVTALPASNFSMPVDATQKFGPSAMADFNGDGKTDIATIVNNVLSVLLGNGDGTFQPAVTLDAGGTPIYVAAADFNGDGKVDLVVFIPNGAAVFLSNGDGTFLPATTAALPGIGRPVVADFNGDGIPDLAFATLAGLNILLSNGDGTFGPVQSILAGVTLLAVGDFNGDGNADLFADQDGVIQVLAGRGDGTFRQSSVNFFGSIGSIAVGDFNGDGKEDFVVAYTTYTIFHGSTATGHLDVYLGRGDGTFQPGGSYFALPFSLTGFLAVGDFNGDGNADFAVTGNGASNIYFGHGDGTFDTSGVSLGDNSSWLGVGDFNADGQTDLITSSGVLFGNSAPIPSTSLTSSLNPSEYGQTVTLTATVSTPSASSVVQFYDGTVALGGHQLANGQASIVSNTLAAGAHSFRAVYYGDTFNFGSRSPVLVQTVRQASTTITLTATPNPASLGQSINLTATVFPSFATGSITFRDGAVLLGSGTLTNGTAALILPALTAGSHAITATYAGDVNDLAATASVTQIVNPGMPVTVTLTPSANPAIYGQSVTLTAALPADATGYATFYDGVTTLGRRPVVKGQASLATCLLQSGKRSLKAYYGGDTRYGPAVSSPFIQTVTALPGTGFHPLGTFLAGHIINSVVSGDFNGDGVTDLAIHSDDTDVSLLLGRRDGLFQLGPAFTFAKYPASASSLVAVGDFNGDGISDLAFGGGDAVTVLLGGPNGSFGPPVNYTATSAPSSVIYLLAGDFNGDGTEDLLVQAGVSMGEAQIVILSGNGDGTFQPPVPAGHVKNFQSMVKADFNGDGKPDLAVLSYDGVTILMNAGDGSFLSLGTFATGDSPIAFAVADFNADGIPDLAVANSTSSVSIFIGQGNGFFGPAISFNVGVSPSSIATGDFNGDGRIDLAVATRSGLDLLLGHGDGTFESPLYFDTGASVTVGDFNGDGIADVALSTPYNTGLAVLLGQTGAIPSVSSAGALNAATVTAGAVAPGSKAILPGDFFVDARAASDFPLPTELAGVGIQFDNGLRAPLFSVSRGQLIFQVPWELAGESTASYTVISNGQSSETQTLKLAATAPGIFTTNALGYGPGLIFDSSGRLIDSSNPAVAGGIVHLRCTGLGTVTPQPPSGSVALSNPVPQTQLAPRVLFSAGSGNQFGTVLSATLVPGTIGEYDVEVVVPSNSDRGAIPVTIVGSNAFQVTINVR